MDFYISSSISLHSHYWLKGLKGTSAGISHGGSFFAVGFIEADSTTSQWSGQRGGQFDFNPDDQREGGLSMGDSRLIQLIHPWCLTWWCPNVPKKTSTKLKDLVLCGASFGTPFCNWAVIDMNLKCGFAKSTTWRYQRYPKVIEFLPTSFHIIWVS